jgi:hypothetical protein
MIGNAPRNALSICQLDRSNSSAEMLGFCPKVTVYHQAHGSYHLVWPITNQQQTLLRPQYSVAVQSRVFHTNSESQEWP